MSIVSSSTNSALSKDATARRGWLSIYADLTKAKLSALVVLSTGVGYIVAGGSFIEWPKLLFTLIGTTLAAASASMLNQLMEMRLDAKMIRTHNRPLPRGEISVMHGFIAAAICAHVGVTLLGIYVNLLAAILAVITILIYVLLYTPLKTRSTLNTFLGAVCGAIPPMIGWASARGTLDLGAWILGAILFVWQLPHFLSLAWLYREDYRRGGFMMLPVVDHTGALTSRIVLLTSLILLPLGLMMTLSGVSGWWFAIGSVLLGLWLLKLVFKLFLVQSDANARRVFLASITYLTLLLCLMVLDRGPASGPRTPDRVAENTVEISTASLLPQLSRH